jgi:hypothetical protein
MSTPPGIYFAGNVKNFTGWPVDQAKQSSIQSLAAQANPTQAVQAIPSAVTPTGAGASGSGSTGGAGNGGAGNNNGAQVVGIAISTVFSSMLLSFVLGLH